MVAIANRKLQFLVAAFLGAVTLVSAQGSYSVDGLAIRGYDNQLSVREYIEEQIELALRDYEEEIQELFARHTQAEINARITQFTTALASSRPLLAPLTAARRRAETAFNRDQQNQVLRTALQKAKNAEQSQRGIIEYNQEQLEYWRAQRPSPPPSPAGKGKK